MLNNAKTKEYYVEGPWGTTYTLAAAAVELALVMESGNNMILPITTKDGTVPALVGNYAIQQVYNNIV